MGYKAWVMMSHLNQEKTETILEMYPLVTCKDCKHEETCCRRRTNNPDWYCADGEME